MKYVYTQHAEDHGLGKAGREVKPTDSFSLAYLDLHGYCEKNYDDEVKGGKKKAKAAVVAEPPNDGRTRNPFGM